VTGSPTFDEPVQSRPTLIHDQAQPDPRAILVVEPDEPRITFTVPVESVEDAGETIKVRLYIDYGVLNAADRPYRTAIPAADLPAAGEARVASADWVPEAEQVPQVPPGCHTVTMIISHQFDDLTQCPEVLADSDQITWHVFLCDEGSECPPPVGDPRLECPVPETRCPNLADEE
jgi:hypothetical protein